MDREVRIAVGETGESGDGFSFLGYLRCKRNLPFGWLSFDRLSLSSWRCVRSISMSLRFVLYHWTSLRKVSAFHRARFFVFILVDTNVLVQIRLVFLVLFDYSARLNPFSDSVLLLSSVHRGLDPVRGQSVKQLILLLERAVEAVHGRAELVPLVGATCTNVESTRWIGKREEEEVFNSDRSLPFIAFSAPSFANHLSSRYLFISNTLTGRFSALGSSNRLNILRNSEKNRWKEIRSLIDE